MEDFALSDEAERCGTDMIYQIAKVYTQTRKYSIIIIMSESLCRTKKRKNQ
mgnify:FL=1